MLHDCLWRTILRGIVLRHTVLANFFGTIAGGASGLSRIGTLVEGHPDGFHVILIWILNTNTFASFIKFHNPHRFHLRGSTLDKIVLFSFSKRRFPLPADEAEVLALLVIFSTIIYACVSLNSVS